MINIVKNILRYIANRYIPEAGLLQQELDFLRSNLPKG